jgi:hypothetical protein
LITIVDDTDFAHAKTLGQTLKVTIFVNGKDVRPLDSVMVDDIRRELKEVCSAVSGLLEKIDLVASHAGGDGTSPAREVGGILQPVKSPSRTNSQTSSNGGADPTPTTPSRGSISQQASTSFDPVMQQQHTNPAASAGTAVNTATTSSTGYTAPQQQTYPPHTQQHYTPPTGGNVPATQSYAPGTQTIGYAPPPAVGFTGGGQTYGQPQQQHQQQQQPQPSQQQTQQYYNAGQSGAYSGAGAPPQ